MSKEENKKETPKQVPQKPVAHEREIPNLNEHVQRNWNGSRTGLEKGENISRRPTMETPIPPPPKKDNSNG